MSTHAHQDGWSSAKPSPAVVRAARILRALADARGRPLTIATLAAEVGAPRTSVGNICAALQAVGMARAGEHGYVLGRTLIELGQAYLDSFDPIRRFDEQCQRLGPRLEETVQLATLDGLDVLYLARRDGVDRIGIASRVGRRLPATCTAVGKAILATLEPGALERRLADAEPFAAPTPRAATRTAQLVDDLARTRERGYAVDDEETTEGIVCLAIAVPGLPGAASQFAISVSLVKVPTNQQRIPGLVAILQELVLAVSAADDAGK